MRRTMLWTYMWTSLFVLATVGCTGGEKTPAGDAANTAVDAQANPAGESGGEGAVDAAPGRIPVPDPSAATVSLAGNLGCGHCTFHATDTCSLAMKTDDGTVYFIEAGDEQESLMDKRYDEPAVLVAGRVSEADGHKTIYADSVTLR